MRKIVTDVLLKRLVLLQLCARSMRVGQQGWKLEPTGLLASGLFKCQTCSQEEQEEAAS